MLQSWQKLVGTPTSDILDKLHSSRACLKSGESSRSRVPPSLPQNNVDLHVGRTDLNLQRKCAEICKCSSYFGRDCSSIYASFRLFPYGTVRFGTHESVVLLEDICQKHYYIQAAGNVFYG